MAYTKEEILQYLETNKLSIENSIKKIKNADSSIKYKYINTISEPKEETKCPKCGTYEGEGYTIGSFMYTIANCKCGYTYVES